MSAEYDSLMARIGQLDAKVTEASDSLGSRLATVEANLMTEDKVRAIVHAEQSKMAKTFVDEIVTRLKQPKTQLAIATWLVTLYTIITQTIGRLPT